MTGARINIEAVDLTFFLQVLNSHAPLLSWPITAIHSVPGAANSRYRIIPGNSRSCRRLSLNGLKHGCYTPIEMTLSENEPRITEIMEDYQATNGCTVISMYGYGSYNVNVLIYGVDCPANPP